MYSHGKKKEHSLSTIGFCVSGHNKNHPVLTNHLNTTSSVQKHTTASTIPFFIRQNSQDEEVMCEKLSTPHEPVVFKTTFSSNTLVVIFCITESVSQIVVDEFCPTLCFSSLRVVGIILCTALLWSHHSISFGLRSELGHCNTLIFFQSFCSRFAGVLDWIPVLLHNSSSFSCWTHGLTFDSGILWCTEVFMINSMPARCHGPVGQIIMAPPDMLCLLQPIIVQSLSICTVMNFTI